MLNAIRSLLHRSPEVRHVQPSPDLMALRRANARRYLRLRGILRVRGVYGAPGGAVCGESK